MLGSLLLIGGLFFGVLSNTTTYADVLAPDSECPGGCSGSHEECRCEYYDDYYDVWSGCDCVDVIVGPTTEEKIELGEGFNMGVLVENFFKIAFPLAIILGFIHIVTAGYTLMTSEGDPRKTNEGKERLEAAIMGLLFVLLTIGILRIILGTLISGGEAGF